MPKFSGIYEYPLNLNRLKDYMESIVNMKYFLQIIFFIKYFGVKRIEFLILLNLYNRTCRSGKFSFTGEKPLFSHFSSLEASIVSQPSSNFTSLLHFQFFFTTYSIFLAPFYWRVRWRTDYVLLPASTELPNLDFRNGHLRVDNCIFNTDTETLSLHLRLSDLCVAQNLLREHERSDSFLCRVGATTTECI